MSHPSSRKLRVRDLPDGFILEVPEIYQLETAAVCNLRCPMCPTGASPLAKEIRRKQRRPFLDVELVRKLLREKAFRGSYFTELHMAGEPTLHPELSQIIHMLKQETDLVLGMSTNGTSLPDSLLDLDYLTISVDTLDDTIRVGRGDVAGFVGRVKRFIAKAGERGKPAIDLQMVELSHWHALWQGYEARVKEVFAEELMLPFVDFRTVPDCFITFYQEPDELPVSKRPCLNPWMSVSIQSNGNVTACCFSFGDDIILGNVGEQRLEEIWNGSEAKELRREHAVGEYREICARCFMRSPALIHFEFWAKKFGPSGSRYTPHTGAHPRVMRSLPESPGF